MLRMTLKELCLRIDKLSMVGRRTIIGIAGSPGSGKSTLAQALQVAYGTRAIVAPMDGFHLANSELLRLGLRDRKGAEPTFDSAGYVALLRRLRHQSPGEVVYAPEFRRELDEPIAGAVEIPLSNSLVLTEGNYLLLDQPPWSAIPGLLDEVWYLELEAEERRRRLIARHVHFGMNAADAQRWVQESDEPNAVQIEATRVRAHLAFQFEATPLASSD